MSKFSCCSVALLTIVAIGCGETPQPASPAATTTAAAPAAVPTNPIEQVVYNFLEAIRIGDTKVSSSLLTPLALQRIMENDMSFAPPASQHARFEIGKVEMFEEDKAAVDAVWTDVDADGAPTKEPMTWALKLTEGQWRISGLIAYNGADQPPVVLDFENPGQVFQSQFPTGEPQQQATPPVRQASQPTQDPFR